MADSDMDAAAILQALKQEVREQYHASPLASALSRATALDEVRATSWVDPHRPIAWPIWPKGIGPKTVAALQKLVRRSLSWYISPLVDDQNRFNAAVVTALEALAQENACLLARLRLLSRDQVEPSAPDGASQGLSTQCRDGSSDV
jgi:hypothetical protein